MYVRSLLFDNKPDFYFVSCIWNLLLLLPMSLSHSKVRERDGAGSVKRSINSQPAGRYNRPTGCLAAKKTLGSKVTSHND